MGKKSKFKKIKRKKFKSKKKKISNNINKENTNISTEKLNTTNLPKKKDKALIHKRKQLKRKLRNIRKKNKNKNLFNVEHEYLDEIEDMLMYPEEIEQLPHDKFIPYPIPNTQDENKNYLPLLISESDIILELLDSRDIIHSRNKEIEELINKNEKKLLIYILTKSDLISQEYLSKIKNSLAQENNNNPIISISSLIRETIHSLLNELKKHIEDFKIKINENKVIKIGILGAPNVGKNSLIQSLELIVNANCNEKYIYFDEGKSFCINSVPCILFDENEENNILISKMNKNIKDIKEPKKLLQNLMNIVNKDILKDIYEFNKVPENLEEFISLIKQKYDFQDDNKCILKILDDIITGKIRYEININ